MNKSLAILAVLAVAIPMASAEGLLPVNPLVNGDFDTYITPGMASVLKPVADRCIGIGHQAYDWMYSDSGDDVFGNADAATDAANGAAADPTSAPAQAEGFATHAQGNNPAAMQANAEAHVDYVESEGGVAYVDRCDPKWREAAMLNAWAISRDRGFHWSNGVNTVYDDFTGDGDREAIFLPANGGDHNLWQSFASATQAISANFDLFEFRIENGPVSPSASNQIGLSLSPGHQVHPYVGLFWEGAVMFRANDMAPDADGVTRMDPVVDGEIICPGSYQPCLDFKADFLAAKAVSDDAAREVLGQARIVQTSFWNFNTKTHPVAIDDVAFVGAKTAVEGIVDANTD